jgi:hypothetical protein
MLLSSIKFHGLYSKECDVALMTDLEYKFAMSGTYNEEDCKEGAFKLHSAFELNHILYQYSTIQDAMISHSSYACFSTFLQAMVLNRKYVVCVKIRIAHAF